MEFLDPKSYNLCPTCEAVLEQITHTMEVADEDTDGPEEPYMLMVDKEMFCDIGGQVCVLRGDRCGAAKSFLLGANAIRDIGIAKQPCCEQ